MSAGNPETSIGRILVYQPAGTGCGPLIDALRQVADVHLEEEKNAAVSALKHEHFVALITSVPHILQDTPKSAGPQLNVVLDSINQGVCLVDGYGRIIWCNAKFTEYSGEVGERIQDLCRDIYRNANTGWPTSHRPRSISLVSPSERFFDATVTPMEDPLGDGTLLVAVVTDVTRARRLQQKMDAIDSACRELVRLDGGEANRMDVRQRLDLLEKKIIQLTRDLLHYDNFVIRLLNRKNLKLDLVLHAGLPIEAQHVDLFSSTENNGISGYVAATGRSYICADASQDPRYVMGIENARSSLTVPLRLHDQVIGIFNIESDKTAAFSEEDRQFAEIFGRHIAIALHILDLLVEERHATTGRLADNVTSEIAGPLGDILADASSLMEDYIGHDDLRLRLQGIADNVVKIRECIKQVTRPVGGILGGKPSETQIDPLLRDKSVLVVDDEEIIRQTVHDVLSRYGCRVELAREGHEAIAMIQRRSYDLVISDIRMPGLDGYSIFAEVKKIRPDCPVIFMTGFGYDPTHSIVRATPEGLAAVLYKPFKVNELLAGVRGAVTA
ncbi:MAG: response regulator [Phycisphaerales bacterium]|nr:response regulator [Phycisphaerales bacterium]